jgi:hypothetical protein
MAQTRFIDFSKEQEIIKLTQVLHDADAADSVYVASLRHHVQRRFHPQKPQEPPQFVDVPLETCRDKCALG